MTIHEQAGTDEPPMIRPIDDKGRTHPEYMGVPEMVQEILTNQREVKDMVEAFIADFANNPMLKMMGKLSR